MPAPSQIRLGLKKIPGLVPLHPNAVKSRDDNADIDTNAPPESSDEESAGSERDRKEEAQLPVEEYPEGATDTRLKSGTHTGSQLDHIPVGNERKRKREEENVFGMGLSQTENRRKYGSSQTHRTLQSKPKKTTANVHESPYSSNTNSSGEAKASESVSAQTTAGPAFNLPPKPPPHPSVSQPEPSKTFKQPPKGAMRPQSQDSACSRSNTPIFNLPKSLLEKSNPKSKDHERVTRSRKPLKDTDSNATPSNSQLVDEVYASKDILGLSGVENLMPSQSSIPESDSDGVQFIAAPGKGYQNETHQDSLHERLNGAPSRVKSAVSKVSQSSSSNTPPNSPTKARCPLCRVLVEKIFFESFTSKKHLSLREQAAFCKAHRVQSAHDEWRDRGYPRINWEKMKARLATYHDRLEEVLRGDKPSFYRNMLDDSSKSGKNRTLKQALVQGGAVEGLSPGYYGSRGAKIIVEDIIGRFSSKLRRLGNSDRLISFSGVSGYVQAVLAPELAVMLVMDDMKTDEDGARAILRDSVDIGNLLNEEEDETLHRISDDEDA